MLPRRYFAAILPLASLLATATPALAQSDSATTASSAGTGQSASAITNGTLDDQHHAVVVIHVDLGNGHLASCSGSLIAPNVVLTARHCVSPLNSDMVYCESSGSGTDARAVTTPQDPYLPSQFAVSTATQLTRSTAYTAVAEVSVPDGTTGASICGHDIALLRLATPIRDAGFIEPRLDIAPRDSDGYTAVGYGITAVNAQDAYERRVRDGLTVTNVGLVRDGHNLMTQAEAEWEGNTGTCSGDSGGPALDAQGLTFGVLSRGDSSTCDNPVYTRVDAFADWIRARTTAAAQALGEAPPAWVTPPPSDPVADGATCRSDAQCASGACAMVQGSRVCQAASATANDASAGGASNNASGLPSVPGAGCSVGPARGMRDPSGLLAALGAAVSLAFARRRKKH